MKLFTAAPVLMAWVTNRSLSPDCVQSVELVSLVGTRTVPVSTRTEAEGLRMSKVPARELMWRSGRPPLSYLPSWS